MLFSGDCYSSLPHENTHVICANHCSYENLSLCKYSNKTAAEENNMKYLQGIYALPALQDFLSKSESKVQILFYFIMRFFA